MKKWKQYIGWVISAALLFVVLRDVDWNQVFESLSRVSWWEPLLLSLIYLFGYQLRGLRSLFLLPGLTFQQALGGVFIGYATNNVFPARLGEVLRAHVVGTSAGIRRTVAFSSVLVERIFDGSAIVVLLLIGAAALSLPESAKTIRMWGIAIFSLALAVVLPIGRTRKLWERYLPSGKLGELLSGLLEGIALATRSARILSLVITSSLLIWTVEGWMFYQCAKAFGMQITFRGALLVMSLVNLGVLIPSSPGGLGLFQFFCVSSLTFLGVDQPSATAYSVLIHLCQFIPVTIIGLLWLPRFGLRLGKLPKNPE